MGSVAVRSTTVSAAVGDDHASPALQGEINRVEDPTAVRCPVSRNHVHMQAAEACRAVITDPCTALGHTDPTMGTGKVLVPADWIGPHLRLPGPVQERPHQSATIEVRYATQAALICQCFRRTAGLRVGIQCTTQRFHLTAGAGLLKTGFQQLEVHGR